MPKATAKPKRTEKRAAPPKKASRVRRATEERPRAPRQHAPAPRSRFDASIWGVPTERASIFSLRKEGQPGRLQVMSGQGVAVEFWPLGQLSVDWVRDRFGPGEYQAKWIEVTPGGGHNPLGNSRRVTIGMPNGTGVRMPQRGGRIVGQEPGAPYREPARHAEPQTPDELDRRVQFERDMAKQQIAHERRMAEERGALERDKMAMVLRREIVDELRDELGDVGRGGGRDDEDESPWKPVASMLGDLLRQALPVLQTWLQNKSGGAPA